MGELIRIGKVATAAAMSTDAIRYYERLGLIPKATRTSAGYRLYPSSVVHRLMVVRNAQRFGFSLRQIASFFGVRDRGGRPCHDVRMAAQRMLDAVDSQIAELLTAREQMQKTLVTWDRLLTATPADRPAYLLERLAAGHDESTSAVRRHSPGNTRRRGATRT